MIGENNWTISFDVASESTIWDPVTHLWSLWLFCDLLSKIFLETSIKQKSQKNNKENFFPHFWWLIFFSKRRFGNVRSYLIENFFLFSPFSWNREKVAEIFISSFSLQFYLSMTFHKSLTVWLCDWIWGSYWPDSDSPSSSVT